MGSNFNGNLLLYDTCPHPLLYSHADRELLSIDNSNTESLLGVYHRDERRRGASRPLE